MEIKRNGTQAAIQGPADWFTGMVRIDPLFLQTEEPARATGASVTFEPGARTAWHTHPLGQTLIVTAGRGRVQREGGPIEEICSGDVAWYHARLDDYNEWQGQPANWEDVRWTGVLEKRDGRWVIVQMHFSSPTDRAEPG